MRRALTTQEVLTAATEYRQLENWEQARKQALEICGEQAHRVIVVRYEHDYREEYQGVHYVGIFDKGSELLWSGGIFPQHEPILFPGYLQENSSTLAENTSTEQNSFVLNENIGTDFDLFAGENNSPELLFQEGRIVSRISLSNDDQQRYLLFPSKNDIYRLDQPPAVSHTHLYLQEDGTSQHQLNYAEIAAYGQMYQARYQWEEIYTLIRDTYGEDALKVKITSYQQSDDEYGYYLLYSLGEVHDKHGNPLEPDPALPIWQTQRFLTDYLDGCAYVTPDGILRKDWARTARFFIDCQLDAINGFTEVSYEFDLDTPSPVPLKIDTVSDENFSRTNLSLF